LHPIPIANDSIEAMLRMQLKILDERHKSLDG